MSDFHVFCCDQCGETQYVDDLPSGWKRRGNEDVCDECVDEEADS